VRAARVAGAVAVATAIAVSLLTIPHAEASAGTPTVAWGTSGLGNLNELQALERKVGRKSAVARQYVNWDTTFPSRYDTWLRDTGHTPVLSIRAARGGHNMRYTDIINASPGSALYGDMARWGDRLKAFHATIYVDFNHEPEADAARTNGSAAQFVAAYRKFMTVIRQRGATNVRRMWVMTANSFRVSSSDPRAAAKYYPGDAYVDAFGADAFNNYRCDNNKVGWTSLAQRIDGFRQFGAKHAGKSLWLPEYGSTEDPANHGRKAQWISDARALLKQPAYHQFRGALYFDAQRAGKGCKWYVDSTAASLHAYSAMGHDVYFTARG
jgi:hypothetical protein